MRKLSAIFLILFFGSSFSQETTVRFDSVSIHLNAVDQDTIFVSFRDRAKKELKIDTLAIDSDVTKTSHKAYIPSGLYLIPDTTELSASADADSSAMYWGPLNPETKTIMFSDTTHILGGTGVAVDAFTEGNPITLPLTRFSSDYVLVIRQDDLTSPIVKWHYVFVRKE